MPNSKNRVVTKKEDCISWEQSKYWWLNCIACSEASMTTQMRGFGFVEPSYEQAIHAFSGGFMNLGHACGLLTGAALATGFLARSLFNDEKKITEATLYTTIQITNEYPELSGSIDCRDITGISVATHTGRFKYLKQGKAKMCGRLHIKWAPQAHDLIEKSLTEFESFNSSKECTNCAVLTMKNLVNRGIIRKEDSMLVAGMAGGVGLSGNVCGALAAGIFALATHSYLCKRYKKRDSQLKGAFHEFFGIKNRGSSAKIQLDFVDKFSSDLCVDICKKKFNNITNYSSFIQNGGCSDVIEHISNSVIKESGL